MRHRAGVESFTIESQCHGFVHGFIDKHNCQF